MRSPDPIEPLRFQRQFVEKPWGGRALERVLGIELPPGRIGETWELVDRDKENSLVAGGPFQGRTVRDVLGEHGAAILGRSARSPAGEFPLLIKFLDAREDLSVQVHPHRRARAHLVGGDGPKTECWYILDAAPGSFVYLGLRSGVDADELQSRAGRADFVDLLCRHEVRAGDFVFVPGGSVHAIGAGVTLAEVQETSDTTYRIYDWGRVDAAGRPRATHVEQALQSIHFDAVAGPVRPSLIALDAHARQAPLIDCEEFAVDLLELSEAGRPREFDTDDCAHIYITLAGEGELQSGRAQRLAPGDTWLVPASTRRHTIAARTPMKVLRVRAKE